MTTVYGKGKEEWLRRGKRGIYKKDSKLCTSVVTCETNLLERSKYCQKEIFKFLVDFMTACFNECKAFKIFNKKFLVNM